MTFVMPHRASWLAAAAIILSLTSVAAPAFGAESTLVAAGSIWKYLDNGSDQGTAWRAPAFNDSGWASGPAELGYGDGDEATVVAYGPDDLHKFITTYFRQQFTVTNRAAIAGLTIRMIRDDGAVVYINGTEVWRTNLPSGDIMYTTLADQTAGADESTWIEMAVSPSVLVDGTNTIAVEMHQSEPSSSDMSFALELLEKDAAAAALLRGPYLQQGTPTSIIIRWRTDVATASRVRFGTSDGNLTGVADDAAVTTEHEVRVSGLAPQTRYYYSVGTPDTVLASGSSHTFLTSPPAGTATPTRIWAIGDSGTGRTFAFTVRDAYYAFAGSTTSTNLWLMLGDNAYDHGNDADYQRAVFDTYPDLLRSTPIWPTLGNHDTDESEVPSTSYPYYGIFTLPVNGEAGGVPSGSESYYSFDYGNIHFICLDSQTEERSATSRMITWLRNDLAATRQTWKIAYWHHPPYSKGSHDSDDESQLIEMREDVVPLLEAAGVDLVLTGHSHSYERSYLIDGHYGHSSTFVSSMKLNGGDGNPAGTGPYLKSLTGVHEGTVYAVAGASSRILNGALNHPAMAVSLNNYGSVVIDINGNELISRYLRDNGAIVDTFTIVKSAVVAAPNAPALTGATPASFANITITWTDRSSDENGFRVERCAGAGCTDYVEVGVTPPNTTTFTDAQLSPSTLYSYRVRAFNTAGSSTPSAVVTTTTNPAPSKRRAVRR
jgi:hypothetical protein